MKVKNIEKRFEETKEDDPRNAAEIAYVIAMIAKGKGDKEKAIKYGKESIDLFDKLNPQTMEECAAINTDINGIALPELIHSGVVRERLKPLEL